MDEYFGENSSVPFRFLDPNGPIQVTQANLPHWRQDRATYYVTFRLGDSLPQQKLQQWRAAREQWLALHTEPLAPEERMEYYRRFPQVLETWLDQGSGSCVLRVANCRQIVTDTLLHCAGTRYELGAYVVAPNHVHAILMPHQEQRLSDTLRSWKGISARRIAQLPVAQELLRQWWQRLRPGSKQVWQKESYDHLVRSAPELSRIERYIANHPGSDMGPG